MTGRCPALAGGITLAAGLLVLFLTGGTRHAIGLVLKPMADAFGWEREAIGALGFVTVPWQVIALYGMVFGIGAGLASPPPVGVMLTRRFPNRTGFANATAIAGTGLGQLVIITGLSFVLADARWRAVFIWLGIANLTLAPFVFWALKERGDTNVARPEVLPTFGSFGAVLQSHVFGFLPVSTPFADCKISSSPPMSLPSR